MHERVHTVVEGITLTRHEWSGLMSKYNLADGHARQTPSGSIATVMSDLGVLYQKAAVAAQLNVQRTYEEAFFRLAGQPSVITAARRPLHHYSSSVSIEAVANHLRATGERVGLLHPTFDNIPAILNRHGVPLRPVSEAIFESPVDPAHYVDIDVLFLITPNNPTGADPAPSTLCAIANQCKTRGVLLVIDFSFRFFSRQLADLDFYAHLEQTGCEYIGIEDSGKTWPTMDLKIGSLVCSAHRQGALQTITDDLLLNVSPFIFTLVAEHVRLEGRAESNRISEQNRATLTRLLADGPVQVDDCAARMSVAWVRLPTSWTATDTCAWLGAHGMAVLPGNPFFWNRPEAGDNYIRVALARPEQEFSESAAALAVLLRRYADEQQRRPVQSGDHSVAPLVLSLARELLARNDITLDDDFFAAGGDSMLAMHLVGRLGRHTGLPLRTTLLFGNPIFRDFAAQVDESKIRKQPATGSPAPAVGPQAGEVGAASDLVKGGGHAIQSGSNTGRVA